MPVIKYISITIEHWNIMKAEIKSRQDFYDFDLGSI